MGWRYSISGVAGVVLLLAIVGCAPIGAPVTPSPIPSTTTSTTTSNGVCAAGPVAARAVAGLSDFTRWLSRERVAGVVGEVGWPGTGADAASWNAVAARWFQSADQAGVGAIQWATGEWWQTSYALSPYVAPFDGAAVSQSRPGAAVLEAHLSVNGTTGSTTWRGVTVAGGEFSAPGPLTSPSSFSNLRPGVYDTNYHFDQASTFTYLASRGITLVRIPFRWEVIQRAPLAALDTTEVARLHAVVARAHAAGLSVLLDVHNYGAYWLDQSGSGIRRAIGSTQVPRSAFADLWSRLATEFASTPGVVGYGLMNEPVKLPGTTAAAEAQAWEQDSQAAVDAIRLVDTNTTVVVGGYEWSGATGWSVRHPRAWIIDPAGKVRYEAHDYFDEDGSGTYVQSYATEVARAGAWVSAPC